MFFKISCNALLVAAVISISLTDALQFTVQPESAVIVPLGDVLLNCMTDEPFIKVSWLFDGLPLPPMSKDYQYAQLSNGSLHISDVQRYRNFRSKPLEYQCLASDQYGTIASHPATVAVAYLDPYPSAQQRQVYGVRGNTALLSCPGFEGVASRPQAKVKWYKDGRPLTDPRALVLPSSDLQLANYSPQDNGLYQCLLENSMLVHSHGHKKAQYMSPKVALITEKLTPVLTFQKLPPSRNSRPVTAVVGQDLMIETVATAKVKPTVIWSKEGLNTLPAERFSRIGEGNLRIKSVRKSDTGYYRITARSGDEVSNHFINLVVQELPTATITPPYQVAKPGASVNMTCSAMNTPYSKLSWYHNGMLLSAAKTPTLTVKPVDIQQDGYYQCILGNTAGITMAIARIKVEATPQFSVSPQAIVRTNITRPLTLLCAATGKPLPTIEWLRDGVTIGPGKVSNQTDSLVEISSSEVKLETGATAEQSKLVIETTSARDSGAYTCRATNTLGVTDSEPSKVGILGPPVLRPPVSPQKAVLGRDGTIAIEVEGLPAPEVKWQLANQHSALNNRVRQNPLSNNLQLSEVRLSDAGIYLVTLTNYYGSVSASIQLDIITPPQVKSASSKDDIVVLGENYWLACNVSGIPLPNVTWYREEKIISESYMGGSKYDMTTLNLVEGGEEIAESKMTIFDIEYRDLTGYTCKATNDAGVATKSLTINYNDGKGKRVSGGRSGGMPLWSIILIIVTVVLLTVVGVSVACFVLHKRRDRKLIRKLSQPSSMSTTIPGMQLSSSDRDIGDGEDSIEGRKAHEATTYSLVMKTLSQPIEPGRGATKQGLAGAKSSPPRSDRDNPAYTQPYGRTPGPGHNTPMAQPMSHPLEFKRDTSLTPVPAVRSRRGRSPGPEPIPPRAPQHPAAEPAPPRKPHHPTVSKTGSSTSTSTEASHRPTPALRTNSLEIGSKGGRQAQGRGFGTSKLPGTDESRSPPSSIPRYSTTPPTRDPEPETSFGLVGNQTADWRDGDRSFSHV